MWVKEKREPTKLRGAWWLYVHIKSIFSKIKLHCARQQSSQKPQKPKKQRELTQGTVELELVFIHLIWSVTVGLPERLSQGTCNESRRIAYPIILSPRLTPFSQHLYIFQSLPGHATANRPRYCTGPMSLSTSTVSIGPTISLSDFMRRPRPGVCLGADLWADLRCRKHYTELRLSVECGWWCRRWSYWGFRAQRWDIASDRAAHSAQADPPVPLLGISTTLARYYSETQR